MKKEFSIYDLEFDPREVATLKLTLQYRKEDMIRKIESHRKDIVDMGKNTPYLSKTLAANLVYFEETIEDIDACITKLNLDK